MHGSFGGNGKIPAVEIRRLFQRLHADRRAATAAEYALILAVIGGSLAIAALTLGDTIGCSIDRSAATVDGDVLSPGHQYGNSNPNGLAKGHHANC